MAKKSVNENVYYNNMYLKGGPYINDTKNKDGVTIALLFANNETDEDRKERKYKYFTLTASTADWVKPQMAKTIQDFDPSTEVTEDSKLTALGWAEKLLEALRGQNVTLAEVPSKNNPEYKNIYINKPGGGGLGVIDSRGTELKSEPEAGPEEEIDLSDIPFN